MTNDTRDRLIESTRELLWERGYAATSPRAILDAADAGQGSMYHHFSGKEELALTAIERNGAEMRAQVADELGDEGTVVERLARYLHREREVLKGCRFGRLAQDPDVDASPELHAAVGGMFAWLLERVRAVLRDGQRDGELPASLDAEALAATVIAALQGGYVLARAAHDTAPFDAAIRGLLEMIAALAPGRHEA